jgi:hypothetical protein
LGRRSLISSLVIATFAAVALWVPGASASAASISGTVSDAASGKPINGAEACAKTTKEGSGACGITDAGGNYEISSLLAASDYRVLFSAGPDYLPQYFEGEQPVFEDADQIDLTGGDADGIDARLEEAAPGSVSGRVTASKTGSPVAEIRVCALVAAQYEVVECALTAADGTYAISLPFGSYKVAFNEPQLEHFNPLYLSQFWNGVTSFAAATTIALGGPEARTGIDANLQMPGETTETPATPPAAVATPSPPAAGPSPSAEAKPALTCRKGFRKERVKGKVRCVKKKHHRKRHAARH